MSVVGEERKRTILEKVEFKGKVKVSELAREFAVSTETIRRYLEELDREKKLKKVYGGAVQLPGAGIEAPMLEREMLHIEEKKRIGYKAATFVEDGDVIAIDDGSTPLQMVPYLVHRKNLTIVTSSFPVATQLISSINKKMFHGEVLFIGGKYLQSIHAYQDLFRSKSSSNSIFIKHLFRLMDYYLVLEFLVLNWKRRNCQKR